jgi:hypothetical protein
VINLFLVLAAFLSGCVSAPVAPNLKLPERSEKVCPKKDLPPIPEKVTIQIDGDTVITDEGGEKLLRQYVLARELLR